VRRRAGARRPEGSVWRKQTFILLFTLLGACSAGEDDGTGDGGGPPIGPVCIAPDPFAPITAAVAYEEVEFDGWPVVRYAGPDPIGLILYFHGTGGNTQQVLQLESLGAMNVYTQSGFAIVATQSEERGEQAQWSDADWDDNPDWQRLAAIRDDLIAQGMVTSETPIFTTGFSNGGVAGAQFATAARDEGWPVAATAPHNSIAYGVGDELPVFYVEAANDEIVQIDVAKGDYEERLARGWRTEYREAPEIAVDPRRFQRIPQFTEEMSANAFTELGTYGLIDAAGNRVIDLEDLESELLRYQNNAAILKAYEVVAQMRVVWATHRYDNQFVAEECRFFVDSL
jgi:predicted esterase